MHAALDKMELSGLMLGPGSLRPGGATYLLLEGWDTGRIKHLGRWKSDTSFDIYLQECGSALVWQDIPLHVRSLVQGLRTAGAKVLSKPPAVDWQHLFSRKLQWGPLKRARLLR